MQHGGGTRSPSPSEEDRGSGDEETTDTSEFGNGVEGRRVLPGPTDSSGSEGEEGGDKTDSSRGHRRDRTRRLTP